MSELEDRRQRAREAAQDACARSSGMTFDERVAVDIAIETATRVRIEDPIVQAYRPGLTPGSEVWLRTRAKLKKAFLAAGFEVEP